MKSNEFAYWLQGYFELRGSDTSPLTGDQVTTIKNHVKLVRETAKKRKKGIEPFIVWIDTAIDVAVEAKMESGTLTTLIQKKINDTFLHVIDPSYGKHKEELLDVHDGGKPRVVPKPALRSPDWHPSGGGGHSNTRYGC